MSAIAVLQYELNPSMKDDLSLIPVLLIGVLAALLIVLPPVGSNLTVDPTRDPTTSASGHAFWAAPAGHNWPLAAHPARLSQGMSSPPVLSEDDLEVDTRTTSLHTLLSREDIGLPEVAEMRRLLAFRDPSSSTPFNRRCAIDTHRPLHLAGSPPQPLLVRAIDVFFDILNAHPEGLGLMDDLIECGAEKNPVEASSGIDVLTRACSLGSLEVAVLLVDKHGAKAVPPPSWAVLARPEISVGYLAVALAGSTKSVSLSVDLFHRVSAVKEAANGRVMLPKLWGALLNQTIVSSRLQHTSLNSQDLFLAGDSFRRITQRITSEFVRGERYVSSGATFNRHGPFGTATALDELASKLFSCLLRAGASLTMLSSNSPQTGNNPLHLAARTYSGLILTELADFAEIRFKSMSHPNERDGLLLPLRSALLSRNGRGFGPLHEAINAHGFESPSVVAITRLAHLIFLEYLSTSETDKLPHLFAKFDEDRSGITVQQAEEAFRTRVKKSSAPLSRLDAHSSSTLVGNSPDPGMTGGGGWHVAGRSEHVLANLPGGPHNNVCDVHEVSSGFLSPDEFKEKFLNQNRPVIIRRALQAQGYDANRLFSVQALLAQSSAQTTLTVGEIPYSDLFHSKSTKSNLADFVTSVLGSTPLERKTGESLPSYAFSADPCDSWLNCDTNMLPSFITALSSQFQPLKNVVNPGGDVSSAQDAQINPQFYLGGPNTGAPFHYHHDAVNILAFGAKRWFLQPPSSAVYSVEPPLIWFNRQRMENLSTNDPSDASGLFECIQQEGDVLFVPESWGHATLNIEASIGVAFEFRVPKA